MAASKGKPNPFAGKKAAPFGAKKPAPGKGVPKGMPMKKGSARGR